MLMTTTDNEKPFLILETKSRNLRQFQSKNLF